MRILHTCSVKRSGETMTVTGKDVENNGEVKVTGVVEIITRRSPPSSTTQVLGVLENGEQIELL